MHALILAKNQSAGFLPGCFCMSIAAGSERRADTAQASPEPGHPSPTGKGGMLRHYATIYFSKITPSQSKTNTHAY